MTRLPRENGDDMKKYRKIGERDVFTYARLRDKDVHDAGRRISFPGTIGRLIRPFGTNTAKCRKQYPQIRSPTCASPCH